MVFGLRDKSGVVRSIIRLDGKVESGDQVKILCATDKYDPQETRPVYIPGPLIKLTK